MPRGRIRGDAGKLDAWAKSIASAPEVLETISATSAEELLGLVKDGFRSESDPYDAPWKQKQVSDGRKVLSGKTSRLKNGWHIVRTSKGGFTVAPSVNYAAWHQRGTKRMSRRAMVPYKGMPKRWAGMLEEASTEALTAHFAAAGSGGGSSSGGFGGGGVKFSASAIYRKAMKAIRAGG